MKYIMLSIKVMLTYIYCKKYRRYIFVNRNSKTFTFLITVLFII